MIEYDQRKQITTLGKRVYCSVQRSTGTGYTDNDVRIRYDVDDNSLGIHFSGIYLSMDGCDWDILNHAVRTIRDNVLWQWERDQFTHA